MLYLYRLSIWCYDCLICLMAPFHQKAKQFRKGRENLLERLKDQVHRGSEKLVWMHVASLGEFEQGRPVLAAIRSEFPHVKILITFFSPSGYEVRKADPLVDAVFYLPMDSPANARAFLDVIRPDLALFVKYEFWYYYLVTLEQRSIPVLMISALFRKNQMYFHWMGRAYLPALQAVTHYFLQDPGSGMLLRLLGIRQWTVAGDTRFDRVLQNARLFQPQPDLKRFKGASKVMVLGSVWPSDRYLLEAFILRYSDEMKFIIAPHEMNEQELTAWGALGCSVRYSAISGLDLSRYRMLLVDRFGMLASLYGYGEYAYVGGSLRGALHNVLEPAVFGIPVFFGAHSSNEKFLEAGGLQACGGGFPCEDPEELEEAFQDLYTDPERYAQAGQAARDFVMAGCGGTEKVMSMVRKLL